MNKKNTWSYDFSWTQPYVSMQGFYSPSPNPAQEMERELDRIDEQVDLMDRYPDAEAMIERLKRDFLED